MFPLQILENLLIFFTMFLHKSYCKNKTAPLLIVTKKIWWKHKRFSLPYFTKLNFLFTYHQYYNFFLSFSFFCQIKGSMWSFQRLLFIKNVSFEIHWVPKSGYRVCLSIWRLCVVIQNNFVYWSCWFSHPASFFSPHVIHVSAR